MLFVPAALKNNMTAKTNADIFDSDGDPYESDGDAYELLFPTAPPPPAAASASLSAIELATAVRFDESSDSGSSAAPSDDTRCRNGSFRSP